MIRSDPHRARCGITRPTQPTAPLTATAPATISAQDSRNTQRSRLGRIPSDDASSSPSESTLRRQRSSRTTVVRAGSAPRPEDLAQVAVARLEQPEHDRGQRRIRVGEILPTDQCGEERTEYDTTEHHHEHRRGPAGREREQEAKCDESEHERAGDEKRRAEAKQQRQCAAEGCARGDPDDVGADQRVAEGRLQGRPGDAQATTHQHGEHDAGKAYELNNSPLRVGDPAVGENP